MLFRSLRMRLGEAYERQGDFPKAVAAYEEAFKSNPKLLPAALKLAQLNAGALKNSAKALEFAKKAHDIAPNDPKAAEILGRVSYQSGNYPVAYGLLQPAARQPAANADVLHDFAWVAYVTGRVAEARATMERLVKDAPNSPHLADAQSFLALTALADGSGDIAAAAPEIDKALAANPTYLPALMPRSALQAQKGDAKTAAATYAEITTKYPDFAPAQKRLAAIYAADPATRDKAYTLAIRRAHRCRTTPSSHNSSASSTTSAKTRRARSSSSTKARRRSRSPAGRRGRARTASRPWR